MDDLEPRAPLDIVDIVLEDDRWEDAGLPAMAERAARAVGDWLELGEFQVVVLGCDDKRIPRREPRLASGGQGDG